MWQMSEQRIIGKCMDMGDMTSGEINREKVIRAGLNLSRVQLHQERILSATASGRATTLPVIGACTTSNGAVIPWKTLVRFAEGERLTAAQRRARRAAFQYWCKQHLGTFVPAAGAASRFMASLQRFVQDTDAHVGELKSFCGNFYGAESASELVTPRSKRLDSLASLASLNVPADIKVIPQLLLDWEKTEVTADFSELVAALEVFFTEGRESEVRSNRAALPKQNDQEISSDRNNWRIHWEAQQPASSDRHHKGLHWLDVLQSQPPVEVAQSNKKLRRELSDKEKLVLRCYAAAFVLIAKYAQHPKGLVPTTAESDSFLFLKLVEQIALLQSSVNIYVAPHQKTAAFKDEITRGRRKLIQETQNIFDLEGTSFAPDWLRSTQQKSGSDTQILEQGLDLCTIRFNEDGTPVVAEDGQYSPVAAGHGELLNLFPEIASQWPQLECLHIRNIDNVIGTQKERQQELRNVAETFRLLRDSIELLRCEVEEFLPKCRGTNDNELLTHPDAQAAIRFLAQLSPVHSQSPTMVAQQTGLTVEGIQKVLGNLFHWQPLPEGLSCFGQWDWLQQQLSRPLSVFGVVRKEVGDVGGGPVFAQLPDGTHVKICLEMPHASKEDAQEYFGNKGRATHFNPVLVFFELRTHQYSHTPNPRSGRIVQPGQLFDEHFWLMAKKEFKGRKVCYHETVLYELIGNSAGTNVVFVEVPRTLFKPHKTLLDSLGQDRRSYGFDETLKGQE